MVLVNLWVAGADSLGGEIVVGGFGFGVGLGCFLEPLGQPLLSGTWSVGSRLGSVGAGLSLLVLILSIFFSPTTKILLLLLEGWF